MKLRYFSVYDDPYLAIVKPNPDTHYMIRRFLAATAVSSGLVILFQVVLFQVVAVMTAPSLIAPVITAFALWMVGLTSVSIYKIFSAIHDDRKMSVLMDPKRSLMIINPEIASCIEWGAKDIAQMADHVSIALRCPDTMIKGRAEENLLALRDVYRSKMSAQHRRYVTTTIISDLALTSVKAQQDRARVLGDMR